jgi:nucleoside-diphosphate-sugar epimerase
MLEYFEDDLNLVLDNTLDSWQEIKNKTIFITGGTGFFGIWLIMSFVFINKKLKLNSKIILLTRNKHRFINKHKWLNRYSEVSFLEGDITNFDFVDEKIDYVIHAATEASVKLNLDEPLAMFDTVVNGTKRVLEFAKIKRVKSFLFTSSGAVYGTQPSNIENISEDYMGSPDISDATSVYGEGKRMAEVLCAVYHKHVGLPIKTARCYAFIGPFLELDSHFAAGNFIGNVVKGEDIIIVGDGTPYRSYMYSADLVIWLWTILFKGTDNTAYNVGSNQSISIAQLAELISKEDDSKHTNVVIKLPPSSKPALRYVPNIDKAFSELNLKIYTDIESCVRKTIDFNKFFLKTPYE